MYSEDFYHHPQNDLLTLQCDVPQKLSFNVVDMLYIYNKLSDN